jgi:hypothetical protein
VSSKPMADVRVLDAEPCGTDTVKKLEEALEKAKAGQLSSVAIAVVYRDGTCGRSWSTAPNLSCIIGSIARLQYAVMEFSEQ